MTITHENGKNTSVAMRKSFQKERQKTAVIVEDPYENKSDFSDASLVSMSKLSDVSYGKIANGRIPIRTKRLIKKVKALAVM